MRLLSDAPLSNSTTRLFQFRLKLHSKDSEPQITQAPSQIAKEWLPDKKGQHYRREKKRYLYQASKQKQVDSHGMK